MTYIDWERDFRKSLKPLSEKEKDEIVSYYREIYSDKRESGMSDEEIISQLGEPTICAAKILAENVDEQSEEKRKNEENNKTKLTKEKTAEYSDTRRKISPASIVGWFFLAVLFIIPLGAVLISVIASFASCAIVGAAVTIGGAVLAIASPLSFVIGYSALGFVATLGAALAMAGIGILVFEVFYILTKYSVFVSLKLTKYLFRKGA